MAQIIKYIGDMNHTIWHDSYYMAPEFDSNDLSATLEFQVVTPSIFQFSFLYSVSQIANSKQYYRKSSMNG